MPLQFLQLNSENYFLQKFNDSPCCFSIYFFHQSVTAYFCITKGKTLLTSLNKPNIFPHLIQLYFYYNCQKNKRNRQKTKPNHKAVSYFFEIFRQRTLDKINICISLQEFQQDSICFLVKAVKSKLKLEYKQKIQVHPIIPTVAQLDISALAACTPSTLCQ